MIHFVGKFKLLNREISWLSFNERVLQEAEDETVPLLERLRFLGIFSNNRDEFFRVRVANLERLSTLYHKKKSKLKHDPEQILDQIQEIVLFQERKFGKIYKRILKELKSHDIYIIDESQLNDTQKTVVENYFQNKVRGTLVPIMLDKNRELSRLKDNAIYLGVKMTLNVKKEAFYSVIEIPTKVISRFLVLPADGKGKHVILLDDVIRHNLKQLFAIFDFDKIEAFTFKLTRDAELDVAEDLSESWIDKLSKSLINRKTGAPVRFVHDVEMPTDLLMTLTKKLGISDMDNVTPGDRYHNFKDFMDFPNVGLKHLRHQKLSPVDHPILKGNTHLLDTIEKQDILLSYPYQSFHHVIDIMREAAIDPKVDRILINLYRVADKSKIINALINAARNGKRVTVILELTARFDEENNIKWSRKLDEEGVHIIHGVPGLKVHSKLILIERIVKNESNYIAHIGTGNFHEGTAQVYGDYSLLTSDKRLTSEVAKLFEFFEANYKRTTFRHLVVSPFNVRRRLELLINNEIRNAKRGLKGKITLKLNNLVDEQLIKKLYDASNAGVKIKLIIRGICALIPGIKGMSENIEAYSIVDRFLEHARVMVFHNNGDAIYLIGSADWMRRNLDSRVEVIAPIFDKKIQAEIQIMLDMQFKDNVKRRLLDQKMSNAYVDSDKKPNFRSQIEQYHYFKSLVKK